MKLSNLTILLSTGLLCACATPARAEGDGRNALLEKVNTACAAEVRACDGQTFTKGLVKCILAKRKGSQADFQVSPACREALQSIRGMRGKQ